MTTMKTIAELKAENRGKLIALRIAAGVHLQEVERIWKDAIKITGEDEDGCWTYDYIWNGGSVCFTLRMVELEKKKQYKKAGKELVKYANRKTRR